MKRPSVLLLALAAGLFAAWIGYLAYLAVTARNMIVLSRPEFLVADLWVIAQVDDLNGPVTVKEVAYAGSQVKEAPKEGATFEVKNLAEAKKDFAAPGLYILPLTREYLIPPVPPSPGYSGVAYHIYPVTPETRAQLQEMRAARP